MLEEFWKNIYPSICLITHFNSNNEKIGSGTGFKANDFLITNNHVFNCPGSSKIELQFMEEDGHTISKSFEMSYIKWIELIEQGMPESSWDYAIIKFENEDFASISNLQFETGQNHSIGEEIAFCGFQLDQENLSIKKGILSSKYKKAGVNYLQIDGSVNNGNSGGPLFSVKSKKVIGIVTRKYTGLTKTFDELLQSFDQNVNYLNTVVDYMNISGFRPIEPSIWVQNQLKLTAHEIYRSSNVGIGLAYELSELLKYFEE